MEDLSGQPEKTEFLAEAEKIKRAQEEAESDLQKRLEQYKDLKYEIYDDEISKDDKYGYEVAGYPKYYPFLKEVDYLLQYAFIQDTDAIIFFDKKARGFGLLANKLLPILALEKAKSENKDPADVKIPKIYFYDPIKVPDVDMIEGYYATDHWKKLSEFIKDLPADKILLFDESSDNYSGGDGQLLWVNPDGSEPRRWKLIDKKNSGAQWERFFPDDDTHERSQYVPSLLLPNVENVRSVLRKNIPDKKFLHYIGGSSFPGGFERSAEREGTLGAVRYNIIPIHNSILREQKEQEKIFVDPATETTDEEYIQQNMKYLIPKLQKFGSDISNMNEKEKINAIKQTLGNYRKQIRDEHSKMAWELFEQVILKKDPYHTEDNFTE